MCDTHSHVITEVTCLLTYLLWLMNFKPTEQLTDLVNDLQTSQNDLPTRRSADQLAS